MYQIHKLTDQISPWYERKKYCPDIILDVVQTFDRVWREALLLKLFLPTTYYLIIRSYLENHLYTSIVLYESLHSSYFYIKADVPRDSDLSLDLFNICTVGIPVITNTTITIYTDDTTFICAKNDVRKNIQLTTN